MMDPRSKERVTLQERESATSTLKRFDKFWLYCGLEFVCLFCIICVYFCQTPLDRQELLCGQLAGVSRCVSELSLSPVRILRLRRNKFAIRMRDDFFWVSEHSGGPAANFEYVYDFILFLNMSL